MATTDSGGSFTFNPELHECLLDPSNIQVGWFVTVFEHNEFGDGWIAFSNPVETLTAWNLTDVGRLIDRVASWTESGKFAAGFTAYESAPAFDPAFEVHFSEGEPLAVFHLYDSPPVFYKELLIGEQPAGIVAPWTSEWDFESYSERFDRVKALIGNGTTYQVNLTYRLSSQNDQDLACTFARLVADDPPSYASIFLSEEIRIASLSPELFFDLEDGVIRCRPMKGTARLGASENETRSLAEQLRTSEKNRAENLMVVDMIRNDLGKVAEMGSVMTPSLFDIEPLATVLQMTSSVQARFTGSIREAFDALFPCASIVGAPKVSTMKIIRKLENSPRGVYTGAIGFTGPGRRARFAVAIRTLSQVKDERVSYGVGSGVVWDSDCEEEWEENRLKAQVLSRSSQEFGFFETIRWPIEDGGHLIELHINRLKKTAHQFGIDFDSAKARTLLEVELDHVTVISRVKLTLSYNGQLSVTHQPLGEVPASLDFVLGATPVKSQDPLLIHKTTRRKLYDRHLRSFHASEVLLFNERQEMTEFSKGNLVMRKGDAFVTPPIHCGLLPGTLRESLVRSGTIQEEIIHLSELGPESEIYRINALTGWIPARLRA